MSWASPPVALMAVYAASTRSHCASDRLPAKTDCCSGHIFGGFHQSHLKTLILIHSRSCTAYSASSERTSLAAVRAARRSDLLASVHWIPPARSPPTNTPTSGKIADARLEALPALTTSLWSYGVDDAFVPHRTMVGIIQCAFPVLDGHGFTASHRSSRYSFGAAVWCDTSCLERLQLC